MKLTLSYVKGLRDYDYVTHYEVRARDEEGTQYCKGIDVTHADWEGIDVEMRDKVILKAMMQNLVYDLKREFGGCEGADIEFLNIRDIYAKIDAIGQDVYSEKSVQTSIKTMSGNFAPAHSPHPDNHDW